MKQPQAGRQVPVVLDNAPAVDARAGFQHQHGQAGVQSLFRDQATDHAVPTMTTSALVSLAI